MDLILDQFPKAIRNNLGNHVKKIILFGSRARKKFNPKKSDYDFLIIVDKNSEQIKEKILDESIKLENDFNELITSIVWDEKESAEYFNYPIGINIRNQGIEL